MSGMLSFLSSNWGLALIAVVTAYLLGSVNTAVIVTKIFTKGKEDIRDMGSGNAGFTNVLRSVGKVPAVLTIICDLLKSVVAVMIGGWLFSIAAGNSANADAIIRIGKYICGFFCILGHSFPIYFHFRGGKGIVTAAGMMLVADWRVFLLILGTFLLVFIISRIISLASIICACMFPVYTFLLAVIFDLPNGGFSWLYVWLCTLAALGICVFVVIKHSSNIGRLIRGEEKKISAKK